MVRACAGERTQGGAGALAHRNELFAQAEPLQVGPFVTIVIDEAHNAPAPGCQLQRFMTVYEREARRRARIRATAS